MKRSLRTVGPSPGPGSRQIGLGLLGPVALLLAAVCPAGCAAGDGSGAAKGKLYLKHCKGTDPGDDLGSLQAPADFDLAPNFFGGEPIEDIKPKGNGNRLVIRMQDAGRRVEDNDLLVFNMDSWRVAQCLRGSPAVLATEALKRFCAYMPGKVWPRLRVGPDFPVRANLVLRKSCPGNEYVVASARGTTPATVNAPPEQWNSWIELRVFGEAGSAGEAEPPDVDPSFKVEFGDRLYADPFHLELVDDRVLYAEANDNLVPEPDMFGFVDGFFDFLLKRGQGAQTFP